MFFLGLLQHGGTFLTSWFEIKFKIMKKLFLFSIAAAISFGAIAQHKNSDNQRGKDQKHKTYKNKDKGDDEHDDGEYRKNRKDDRYDRDGREDRNNNGRNAGRNLPRKVRDAFQRDYPNAGNVDWTKSRGVWTADFRRSGIFGGSRTVSYKANGQRVNNNNNNRNNPILGRNNASQQSVF